MLKAVLVAAAAWGAALMIVPTSAEAAVCARGVYRAGCAGPNGAVVAHRPHAVAAPRAVVVTPRPVVRCTYVNGRRVCR